MSRIAVVAGLLIVAFLAAFVFFSHANQSSGTVKIVMIKGNPKILKADKSEWQICAIEMPVASGDRIKTQKAETVDIAFTLRSTVAMRIEENSDVFIKNNTAPYSTELLNGAVMASIKNLPRDSRFEVRTPTAVSGARGTGWRSATDGNRSVFDAFDKSIYIRGIDQAGNEMEGELKLDSGFRATVDRFERPSRIERLSGSDRERWSEWRSEFRGASESPGGIGDKLDNIDNIATKAAQAESRRMGGVNETEDTTRIEERTTTTDTGRTSTSGYKI